MVRIQNNYQRSQYNKSVSATYNKENKDNKSDDLIIDDNTIYEIDQDCYNNAKRNRTNQKGIV